VPVTTAPEPAPSKIKVTQTAYDLAMRLFAAHANETPVPVTEEMIASKLSELTAGKKKVAQRLGFAPGRYSKPGTVKLLVDKSMLEPVPHRAPRKVKRVDRRTPTAVQSTLSIDDLERFVSRYREIEAPLRAEQTKAVNARIAELQKHLAIAKGDDFRNTMAMANRELRALDEIDRRVNELVLSEIKPALDFPLQAVWSAMRDGLQVNL
jgi:hypothetical protein